MWEFGKGGSEVGLGLSLVFYRIGRGGGIQSGSLYFSYAERNQKQPYFTPRATVGINISKGLNIQAVRPNLVLI